MTLLVCNFWEIPPFDCCQKVFVCSSLKTSGSENPRILKSRTKTAIINQETFSLQKLSYSVNVLSKAPVTIRIFVHSEIHEYFCLIQYFWARDLIKLYLLNWEKYVFDCTLWISVLLIFLEQRPVSESTAHSVSCLMDCRRLDLSQLPKTECNQQRKDERGK